SSISWISAWRPVALPLSDVENLEPLEEFSKLASATEGPIRQRAPQRSWNHLDRQIVRTLRASRRVRVASNDHTIQRSAGSFIHVHALKNVEHSSDFMN